MADAETTISSGELVKMTEYLRQQGKRDGKIGHWDDFVDITRTQILSTHINPFTIDAEGTLQEFKITLNELHKDDGSWKKLPETTEMDGATLKAYQDVKKEYDSNGIKDQHEKDVMQAFTESQSKVLGSSIAGAIWEKAKDIAEPNSHSGNVARVKAFAEMYNLPHEVASYDGKPTYEAGFTPLNDQGIMDKDMRAAINSEVQKFDVAAAAKEKSDALAAQQKAQAEKDNPGLVTKVTEAAKSALDKAKELATGAVAALKSGASGDSLGDDDVKKAQVLVATLNYKNNEKGYGIDGKNGKATHGDLIAFANDYNKSHQGANLNTSGEVDSKMLDALQAAAKEKVGDISVDAMYANLQKDKDYMVAAASHGGDQSGSVATNTKPAADPAKLLSDEFKISLNNDMKTREYLVTHDDSAANRQSEKDYDTKRIEVDKSLLKDDSHIVTAAEIRDALASAGLTQVPKDTKTISANNAPANANEAGRGVGQ